MGAATAQAGRLARVALVAEEPVPLPPEPLWRERPTRAVVVVAQGMAERRGQGDRVSSSSGTRHEVHRDGLHGLYGGGGWGWEDR